jgi:ribosomal protein S18 acetylase RimI-like enzyme
VNDSVKFEIKPASLADVGELRKLEQVCFGQDSWPLFDLLGVLTFPGIVRLKAVVDERMAGFAAGDRKMDEGRGWVTTIGVHPDYRRSGIGKALLAAIEEGISRSHIRLCVRKNNLPAIRMYEQTGYQHVGLWPDYYADGEDALVMEKVR